MTTGGEVIAGRGGGERGNGGGVERRGQGERVVMVAMMVAVLVVGLVLCAPGGGRGTPCLPPRRSEQRLKKRRPSTKGSRGNDALAHRGPRGRSCGDQRAWCPLLGDGDGNRGSRAPPPLPPPPTVSRGAASRARARAGRAAGAVSPPSHLPVGRALPPPPPPPTDATPPAAPRGGGAAPPINGRAAAGWRRGRTVRSPPLHRTRHAGMTCAGVQGWRRCQHQPQGGGGGGGESRKRPGRGAPPLAMGSA